MEFEWNSNKATSNLAKHDVSFQEASTVFGDPLAFTFPDPDHSHDETRYITIGESIQGRLLIISHTDIEQQIRIISARKLTRQERKIYEND
ncbi:MAG: BrnT family toxin [Candidatus Poribacteria bacterium]|nr:BrnT family toxin [Candidatus Poribacteria bacterium]